MLKHLNPENYLKKYNNNLETKLEYALIYCKKCQEVFDKYHVIILSESWRRYTIFIIKLLRHFGINCL